MSHHVHIGFDVASRGMQAFAALEHAVADARLRAAGQRLDGIHAVGELAIRLQESRAVEATAIEAAEALHAENHDLRSQVATLTAALRGERQAHASDAGVVRWAVRRDRRPRLRHPSKKRPAGDRGPFVVQASCLRARGQDPGPPGSPTRRRRPAVSATRPASASALSRRM